MTRTKDWLQYSEELVEIADLLSKNNKYNWSCFTFHQAATAALKAILSKKDELTFGDNLIKLLRQVDQKVDIPKEVKKACHAVNDYFKTTRDLELKPAGTPLDHFTEKDCKNARENTMILLRFAFHESN